MSVCWPSLGVEIPKEIHDIFVLINLLRSISRMISNSAIMRYGLEFTISCQKK